ncbi:PQQ-dependent sugar dehydrogenase [Allosphingosinicella flava]|nr:PQQ-dependent sugar dehydrogenase [Sphingosinicella flava]
MGAAQANQEQNHPFKIEALAKFEGPWSMTFLPGTSKALVTEQSGKLYLWEEGKAKIDVAGVPAVWFAEHGGFADVIAHPKFADNKIIYMSYAEPGEADTRGTVVARAKLVTNGNSARLEDVKVIWRQVPKVTGGGQFGARMAFSPDGYLFISSGDRVKFEPAIDTSVNLGKIIRLTENGEIPASNPYYGTSPITAQIWSVGHRDPLGLAFDAEGRLWEHEMGPKGGDEFNLIERSRYYGWPVVSNGDHYDGQPIARHSTRTDFVAPQITWDDLAPAGLMIYSGNLFPQWKGSAFLGGLAGQSIVRVELNGAQARQADRWAMGARIREVEQGPEGAIYVLEDGRHGSQGRLLRLTPKK